MAEVRSLSQAVKEGLALKDKHGYVLPFQGGRFRLTEENDLVDTGVVNQYPTSAERFKYRVNALINGTGDGGDSGDNGGTDPGNGGTDPGNGGSTTTYVDMAGQAGFTAAMLADVELENTPVYFRKATSSLAASGAPIAMVNYNHGLGIIACSRDNNTFRLYPVALSAQVSQNGNGHTFEHSITEMPLFDTVFVVDGFAYAMDFATSTAEVVKISGSIEPTTTVFNPVENSTLRGIHSSRVGAKNVIYSLHLVDNKSVYIRSEVEVDAETGLLTVITSNILNKDVSALLGANANDLHLGMVDGGTANFYEDVNGTVFITDLFAAMQVSVMMAEPYGKPNGLYPVTNGLAMTYEGVISVRVGGNSQIGILTKDATGFDVSYSGISFAKAFAMGAIYYNPMFIHNDFKPVVNSAGYSSVVTAELGASSNFYRNTFTTKTMGSSSVSNEEGVEIGKAGMFEAGKDYTIYFNLNSNPVFSTPTPRYVFLELVNADGTPALTLERKDNNIYAINGEGEEVYLKANTNVQGSRALTLKWNAGLNRHEAIVMAGGYTAGTGFNDNVLADVTAVDKIGLPATGKLAANGNRGEINMVNEIMIFDKTFHYQMFTWLQDVYLRDSSATAEENTGLSEYEFSFTHGFSMSNIEDYTCLSFDTYAFQAAAAGIHAWESLPEKINDSTGLLANVTAAELGIAPKYLTNITETKILASEDNKYVIAELIFDPTDGPKIELTKDAAFDISGLISETATGLIYDRLDNVLVGSYSNATGCYFFRISVDADFKPVSLLDEVLVFTGAYTVGKAAIFDDTYLMHCNTSYTKVAVSVLKSDFSLERVSEDTSFVHGLSNQYSDLTRVGDTIICARRTTYAQLTRINHRQDLRPLLADSVESMLIGEQSESNASETPSTKLNNIAVYEPTVVAPVSYVDINGEAGFKTNMLSDIPSDTSLLRHHTFDSTFTSHTGDNHIIGGNYGQKVFAVSSNGQSFKLYNHNVAGQITTGASSYYRQSNVKSLTSFDNIFVIGDFTYMVDYLTGNVEIQDNTAANPVAVMTVFNPVENTSLAGVYANSVGGKHVLYSLHYMGLELIYLRSEVEIGADGNFTSMKCNILNRNLVNTLNCVSPFDMRLAYVSENAAYFKSESERIIYVTDIFGQRQISAIESPFAEKVGGIYTHSGVLCITYQGQTTAGQYSMDASGRVIKDPTGIDIVYTSIEHDKAFPFGAIYSNSFAADLNMEASINAKWVDTNGSAISGTIKSSLFRGTSDVFLMGSTSTTSNDGIKVNFPMGFFQEGKDYTFSWCASTVSHSSNPNTHELMRLTDAEGVAVYMVRWSGSRIMVGEEDYIIDTSINFSGEIHVSVTATWDADRGAHRFDLVINDRAAIPTNVGAFYGNLSNIESINFPGAGNDVTLGSDFGTVLGCNQKLCDFTVHDYKVHGFIHSWKYLAYATTATATMPTTKQVDELYFHRSSTEVSHSGVQQISFYSGNGSPVWGIWNNSAIAWEYAGSKIEEGNAHDIDISCVGEFGWKAINIQSIERKKAFVHNAGQYGFLSITSDGESSSIVADSSADYDITSLVDGSIDGMGYDTVNKCLFGTTLTSGNRTAIFVVKLDAQNKPVNLLHFVDIDSGSVGYGKPAFTGTHYLFASNTTNDKIGAFDIESGTFKILGGMTNLNGVSLDYCNLEINNDGYLLATRESVGTSVVIAGIADYTKRDFEEEAYHDALLTDEHYLVDQGTKINVIDLGVTPPDPDPDPTPDPDPEPTDDTLSSVMSNGSNINASLAKFFKPVKVGPYRKYRLDHSIPLNVRAVNLPDLAPVPINLAYLYALSRKPIVHSDEFLLTPGNLLPRFANNLEGPLSEDFVWEVRNEEPVIDPGTSTLLGHSLSVHIGVAYDVDTKDMFCMYSGEPIIAGTNREEILVATNLGEFVTVRHADLIAYGAKVAKPSDGKVYELTDGTDLTFNPDNIWLKEVQHTSTAVTDTSTDWVLGNE